MVSRRGDPRRLRPHRRRVAPFYTVVLPTALFGAFLTITAVSALELATPVKGAPNAAPQVIPSLREWQGGRGFFVLGSASRIVVDPAYAVELQSAAQIFQGDLLQVSRLTLPVVTASSPRPGDFFLTLAGSDPTLGGEGYLFSVGRFVAIRANTRAGIFYGTRTALQILLQDADRALIPRGTARDYPRYQERGLMLDVGRKFFPLPFLEDYVRFMAWFKLNDFHLHLNDNALQGGDGPDWMHQYAAFRLNSERFPGLAAKDGSYTRQDMRALQDIAEQYGVTITPEIDMPAHSLAFTQYRPNLASPTNSKEFLDLSNPATFTFVKAIWDEFLPWFDTSQVHIGADEYAPSDAGKYREFINWLNAYLRSRGKTVRMWGSLTEMKSSVHVNTNIVVDAWNNGWANPVEMARQGFQIINANDALLYIVPKAGYYHDYLDTRQLYKYWEPYIFDLSNSRLNLDPNDSHLLGGTFAVWNDRLGSVISDADVHARVKPAMPVLGQKLWAATSATMSYDEFEQVAERLGDAPGTRLPQTASLAGPLPETAAASFSVTLDRAAAALAEIRPVGPAPTPGSQDTRVRSLAVTLSAPITGPTVWDAPCPATVCAASAPPGAPAMRRYAGRPQGACTSRPRRT